MPSDGFLLKMIKPKDAAPLNLEDGGWKVRTRVRERHVIVKTEVLEINVRFRLLSMKVEVDVNRMA